MEKIASFAPDNEALTARVLALEIAVTQFLRHAVPSGPERQKMRGRLRVMADRMRRTQISDAPPAMLRTLGPAVAAAVDRLSERAFALPDRHQRQPDPTPDPS